MSIEIGGITPFTTIDYPGKLAAVIFLVGCPLRCVYCSNPHLLNKRDGEYDSDKVFDFIKSRVGKLQAIVFSGGESLMQGQAAIDYMRQVKELGFLIGLHTNGFYPELLSQSLDVVDWVGLDIKTDSKNYEKLTGNKNANKLASESVDILIKSEKPFECRITADPRFIDKVSLMEIAVDLSRRGVKNFAIQRYIPHTQENGQKTTEIERNQFFNDESFTTKLEKLFDSLVLRN